MIPAIVLATTIVFSANNLTSRLFSAVCCWKVNLGTNFAILFFNNILFLVGLHHHLSHITGKDNSDSLRLAVKSGRPFELVEYHLHKVLVKHESTSKHSSNQPFLLFYLLLWINLWTESASSKFMYRYLPTKMRMKCCVNLEEISFMWDLWYEISDWNHRVVKRIQAFVNWYYIVNECFVSEESCWWSFVF